LLDGFGQLVARSGGHCSAQLVAEQRVEPLGQLDEIEREMGRDPSDSLNRLYGSGLIHRLDGKRLFWATRAALMADEIAI
jgi:hypothetical protein